MLGSVLIFYFIVLSILAYAAYPVLATIGLWFDLKRGPTRFGRWVEFVFCFLHPIVYLALLKPTIIPNLDRYAEFMGITWVAFGLMWLMRAFGGNVFVNRAKMKRTVKWLSAVVVLLILLHMGQDAYYWYKDRVVTGTILTWVAGLYLLPLCVVIAYFRTTKQQDLKTEIAFHSSRPFGYLIVGTLLFRIGWEATPSQNRVQQLLNENAETIEYAARSRGLDPKLLAATIYVAQTEYGSLLRTNLENLIMDAWLFLACSYFPQKGLEALLFHRYFY